MYAPKFRSWLTGWDRLNEVIDYKADLLAQDIKAEFDRLNEELLPAKNPQVVDGPYGNALAAINMRMLASKNRQIFEMAAIEQYHPGQSYPRSLGGIFQ